MPNSVIRRGGKEGRCVRRETRNRKEQVVEQAQVVREL